MFGLKLEVSDERSLWAKIFVPIFAISTTLAVTLLFIVIAHADPIEVFYYMLVTPLTSRLGILEILAESTPLILTGIAVVVAFTTGYYNIGAEGQLYAGALMATLVGLTLGRFPPPILIPTAIFLGFVGGALWSAVAAVLKLKLGNDEVVTTILMNVVMILFVTALLNGPLRDPACHSAQSSLISPNAHYPLLAVRSRAHLGLVFSLIAVVGVAILLRHITFGFEMRAVGANPDAARYAGMDVNRTILLAAVLSGGLVGIAGGGEVLGVHHRLISTLSPGYGFTGIVVAKFASLNPWLTIVAAVFMATLDVGAQMANLKTGVSIHLAGVARWALFLATLTGAALSRYRLRRR